MANGDLGNEFSESIAVADSRGTEYREGCEADRGGALPIAKDGPMRSSSPEFESACQLAIRRAGDLVPLGRDRIVEDLRIRFDHAGEYVAYIDRMKTVKNARRLCREVLACGRSLKDVQHAVEIASESDQSEVVVAYIEEDDEGPQFPYELPGR